MTPEDLIKKRRTRRMRGDVVTFWLDGQYQPLPNAQEIALKPKENVRKLDLRGCKDLACFINTNELTDQSEQLFAELKKVARFVMVAVIDNFDESYKWNRDSDSLMPV